MAREITTTATADVTCWECLSKIKAGEPCLRRAGDYRHLMACPTPPLTTREMLRKLWTELGPYAPAAIVFGGLLVWLLAVLIFGNERVALAVLPVLDAVFTWVAGLMHCGVIGCPA